VANPTSLTGLSGEYYVGNRFKEYIVVYDVSDTKQRTKLYEALKDYGMMPIQKSVFWGRLLYPEMLSLSRMFQDMLEADGNDKAFITTGEFSKQIMRFGFGHKKEEFLDSETTVIDA